MQFLFFANQFSYHLTCLYSVLLKPFTLCLNHKTAKSLYLVQPQEMLKTSVTALLRFFLFFFSKPAANLKSWHSLWISFTLRRGQTLIPSYRPTAIYTILYASRLYSLYKSPLNAIYCPVSNLYPYILIKLDYWPETVVSYARLSHKGIQLMTWRLWNLLPLMQQWQVH